ncbi:MAG: sodium:solute symporter family protein [Puniceicoccaceae bacterium]
MAILIPVLLYFSLTFGVALYFSKTAGRSKEDFFLGGRSLPWWVAGISIVATTFAADTPLAITGMIAAKGLSGNWFWMSVMGTHTAIAIFFARYWSRLGTVTDSQLIALRYSGKSAGFLRLFRAGLSGLLMNCIIMGWVIRAMVKVIGQLFDWQEIAPGLFGFFESFWPTSSALGTPGEGITVLVLILLVAIYSSMGGLKGVIITDLFQFILAVGGSIWLAMNVWDAAGGQAGILEGLSNLYGEDHQYLNLFPSADSPWLQNLEMGLGFFGLYLIAQGIARPEVDGGTYFMQRLNSCRSEKDARRAGLVFVFFQYLVRAWPWMVVGIGALVLIPLGNEAAVFNGEAAAIGGDRELAYPFLIKQLLSPWVIGFLTASFLAAFMSTMDTHLNWGSSYIVNDWLPSIGVKMSPKAQGFAGRLAVLGFALVAILVSFQINTVEQGWRWMAAITASLAVPSLLRWFWWRVSAFSEITAIGSGLVTAIIVHNSTIAYEFGLIYIIAVSTIGMLLGMFFGPKTDPEVINAFYEKVQPKGAWPKERRFPGREIATVLAVVAGVILMLRLCIRLIFGV